jgi:hypothetical protein
MGEQRLGLRREQQPAAADPAHHQRLDAESVAHQEHPAAGLVVQAECVDAVEARQQVQSPLGVAVQQHLGVAVGREGVALPFQRRAQFSDS